MTGLEGAVGSEAAAAAPGPALAGGSPGSALADRPLVQHLCDRARTDGRRPAFRAKAMGIWHDVTWAQHRDTIEHLALGLQALGVGRGDRVALLAPNGPAWLSVDLATQSLGAAAVGFYPTTTDAELAGLLAATTPAVLVAGALVDVERLLACGHAGVDAVVVLEPAGVSHADGRVLVGFAELLERGASRGGHDSGAWERAVADTSPDDVAAVVCTLGTTGVPKVVELSSRDLVLGAAGCLERVGPPGPRDRTVVRLPLAHLAERQLGVYASVLFGCVTHLPEDDVTVGEATLEVQPTIVAALPADWTAAAGRVDAGVADSGRLARTVWRASMALRRRQQRAQWQGRRPSSLVRVGAWLGYWAVCRPVLGKFGYAQLRCAVTVNEPLPTATAERWNALGVRLHEAYTLVEGGGFVAVQARPGASLSPVTGSEARLADDGELLLRRTSPSGHHPDGGLPSADGGWLRTGDLAEIAGDGGLRVLGRRDDVVTLEGRPVMTTEVERRLRQSPFVGHAVVCEIGEGRIGALLEPDARALGGWARQQGLGLTGYAALVGSEEVRALLDAEVAVANRGLAADGLPEVSAHRLLPHPLEADTGEELTALHTVRREAVLRRHAALVDDMAGRALTVAPGGAR